MGIKKKVAFLFYSALYAPHGGERPILDGSDTKVFSVIDDAADLPTF